MYVLPVPEMTPEIVRDIELDDLRSTRFPIHLAI